MTPPNKKSTGPTSGLPAYVKLVRGQYYWRPYIPQKQRGLVAIDKYGYLKPPVNVGRQGDPVSTIIRNHLRAKLALEATSNEDKYTLGWLRDQYTVSERFKKLKPDTQASYFGHINRFLSFPMKRDGVPITLGDLHAARLTKQMIRRIIDKQFKKYRDEGKQGGSTVNGQFRVFSAMLTWGIQYYEGLGLESNPCLGIEKLEENVRERYVTDEEYELQLNAAIAHSPAYLPIIFEHAYLLAARSIEAASLKVTSAEEVGYFVKRRKGSKDTMVVWSDRLRAAHQAAIEYRSRLKRVQCDRLIPSYWGNAITKNTLQASMAKLKKIMAEHYPDHEFWHLHDLKRKGISDAENKRIAGHKSVAMMQRYMVKLETFEPPA